MHAERPTTLQTASRDRRRKLPQMDTWFQETAFHVRRRPLSASPRLPPLSFWPLRRIFLRRLGPPSMRLQALYYFRGREDRFHRRTVPEDRLRQICWVLTAQTSPASGGHLCHPERRRHRT